MIEALADKHIVVLYGGFSRERDVSLRSGQNVYDALCRMGYRATLLDPVQADVAASGADIVFNALHGQYGEDGSVQAYLDSLGIAYTGSGVAASILAMNKGACKQLLVANDLPTAPFVLLNAPILPDKFSFPFFVKPVNEGSSVGVHVVDCAEDFEKIVPELIERYGCIMAEAYVEGPEITVSNLEVAGSFMDLPVLELRSKRRFYDYVAKYTDGCTDFVLPAQIDESVRQQCQSISQTVHRLLGCRGVSRVDMIVHPSKGPMILEVNTLPGLTVLSDLPAQAAYAGVSFDRVVELILMGAQ